MKKLYLALILVICVMTGVYGQTGPKDLILVLDTSASMSSSYRDVSAYLPGAFIQEHLRIGDTFHLIPFSGNARLDIARRIEGRGEVETIVSRMLLQYPLDSWSDISTALTFTENYLTSLPNRPKKIVLVSDGIVFLPPGSSSRQLDSAGVDNLISDTKNRLASKGVTLEYVKIAPGVALPAASRTQPAGGTSTAQTSTSATGGTSASTGSTSTTSTSSASGTSTSGTSSSSTSGSSGTSTGSTSTSSTSTTGSTSTASGTTSTSSTGTTSGTTGSTSSSTSTSGTSTSDTDSWNWDTEDTRAQTGTENSDQSSPGASTANEGASSQKTDTSTQPPVRSSTSRTAGEQSSDGIPSSALFIGLAIIGLIALILIILLISKEMHRSPNKAMSRAATGSARDSRAEADAPPFKDHSKELAGYASSQSKQRTTPYSDHRSTTETQTLDYTGGPVTLNLFVEDQNTHIGKRNIHSVKPGYTFTVGGGKSDFLIFLVPLPANLGELKVNGNRCTFTPKKPQYFPEGSQPVQDCIGKTIRVVSDKNYEVRFRFERYEDPLHALNRLLNSVKVAEKAPETDRYTSKS